jgi:hypothetical protein
MAEENGNRWWARLTISGVAVEKVDLLLDVLRF